MFQNQQAWSFIARFQVLHLVHLADLAKNLRKTEKPCQNSDILVPFEAFFQYRFWFEGYCCSIILHVMWNEDLAKKNPGEPIRKGPATWEPRCAWLTLALCLLKMSRLPFKLRPPRGNSLRSKKTGSVWKWPTRTHTAERFNSPWVARVERCWTANFHHGGLPITTLLRGFFIFSSYLFPAVLRASP